MMGHNDIQIKAQIKQMNLLSAKSVSGKFLYLRMLQIEYLKLNQRVPFLATKRLRFGSNFTTNYIVMREEKVYI